MIGLLPYKNAHRYSGAKLSTCSLTNSSLGNAVYIHALSVNPAEVRNMDDMTRREREHEEQYAWWLTQTNNRQDKD